MRTTVLETLNDLWDGLRRVELWSTLAYNDIAARYHRSVLGPFWVALSLGVMVGSIGFVWGSVFKTQLDTYIPYLTVGFIAWTLVASFISEGSNMFFEVAGLMKQIRIPVTVHMARLLARNLIIFGHNLLVYLLVAVIFGVNAGWHVLLIVPALALLLVNGGWMSLLVGAISIRFRDVRPAVLSALQFLFFFTPVMWLPPQLDSTTRFYLTDANPMYHAIEVIRQPLLGHVPSAATWLWLIVLAILGWSVTIAFLAARGRRIAFWL